MKPQYSVSIIVPVYNVERYIERCLKAIINQSYDGNIECLLVNEATKDKSIEVINRFLNEYDGKIIFKLIEHETNRGLSAARNTGIKNANGDFLYFLDSDDEISHDCIKLLMKSIESDTEMVQGNTKIIPKLDYLERYVTINDRLGKKISDHILIKQYIMLKLIPVTSWNKLVRLKLIIAKKLYIEEGWLAGDDY